MSSTGSPSTSSASSTSDKLSELLDGIINTKLDGPAFNLNQLITDIDNILALYDTKLKNKSQKKSKSRNKLDSTADVLPSASHASQFAEEVSKDVKTIANQISDYSGDNHKTAIAVLNGMGNTHWIGVGLLVVAAVLEGWDKTQKNDTECLKLLKSMNELAKAIKQLQPPSVFNNEMMQTKIKESIHLIVEGAIICCVQKKKNIWKKFFKNSKYGQDLEELRSNVEAMYKTLQLQITVSTYDAVQSSTICRPLQLPLVKDAVGINERKDEIIQLLELENGKPTVGVVVYGIGGCGKTTLADKVCASLKLQDWKYSKVTLIQNLEAPDIKDLQSKILEHLTGTKQTVTDCERGREQLKSIMEKENVFIYIDNVLCVGYLKELLPNDVTSPKRFRILVTARKSDVGSEIENCRIRPCKIYPVKPLSVESAVEVLCREIDRERDTKLMLEERPQVGKIAEKCSCCPLFLEVVGRYLRKRQNQVSAYERVFNWLECGESFSCEKAYSFDEDRILFSYNELLTSAQEAFLDVCSFFCGWEWDTVGCIVGEEELKCLEEGALIKEVNKRVSIHDLLLTAGQNKSKGNRFRSIADFSLALEEDEQVLCQAKGVWLRVNRGPFHLPAEKLDSMSRSLRVLSIGRLVIVEGKCSQRFNQLKFLQVDNMAPNMPLDIGKLRGLTYVDCSAEEKINWSACKNLQVLRCQSKAYEKPHKILGISGVQLVHFNKLKQLVLKQCHGIEISCLNKLYNLQKLQLQDRELEELPESFGKLPLLQEMDLTGCESLTQLPASFCELSALTMLSLGNCHNLKNLPRGFHKLSSLQRLNLRGCSSLQELPCHFDRLVSLQSLDISRCSSLTALPESLGNLPSLNELSFQGCKKLTSLPHSIGEWKPLSHTDINFNGCSSLGELPDEIGKLTMLTRISLDGCSSLKLLPDSFGEFIGLQKLDLSRCSSLMTLPSGFSALIGLQHLNLSGCSALSSLCQGFGNLSCLRTLKLSGCDSLKELCNDFHLLGALSDLNLSECNSLSKLAVSFGELGGLEILDLSGCSILEELSDTFHCLRSLRRLDLSNCKKMGGKWMDIVAAIQSLRRLDIEGSEKMIQRWTQMQREKEKWHMVVVTISSQEAEQVNSWLLKEVGSKLSDKGGFFIGKDQRPFCISSVLPETPLILIIDFKYGLTERVLTQRQLNALENNLQWVESRESKELKIIYVGTQVTKLNFSRILAYTPDATSTLFLNEVIPFRRKSMVLRSKDGLEENCLKCLSMWEDISYILNETAFIARTPRDSNIDLLRRLLVTRETDFLLLNNHQVKVNDLQGKVVLLLLTRNNDYVCVTSLLKDLYVKMRNDYNAEVVWIPYMREDVGWDEFKKAATNAQLPVIPNPWETTIWRQVYDAVGSRVLPAVTVVDEKGRICCKDALPMIARWGVEAYPFSESREEEVREAEWKELQLKPLSTLEFVFQNVEAAKVEAAIASVASGGMIFICVGLPAEMLDFAPVLENSVKMLESCVQLFYVARDPKWGPILKEDEYEMKRKEMCTNLSLSLLDAYKFWQRVRRLKAESRRMEDGEKMAKVKKMVQGLLAANRKSISGQLNRPGYKKGIRIIVVDENGEMVSKKGKEMVKLLCEGGEEAAELVSDMKNGGITSVFEKRWREG